MNRIFYNTLIFILALFFGGVIVVFSIRPSSEEKTTIKNGEVIRWSKVSLTTEKDASVKVKEEVIDILSAKVSQDTPILVDFGRLSSFLYLASP
jgi:hypothetical protein